MENKKLNIAIIGAGSWGTAIALVIANKNKFYTVKMWAYENDVVDSINDNHLNKFLPHIILPENIKATSKIKDAVSDADIILIATPSKVVYNISLEIKKYLEHEPHIGFLTKGFYKVGDKILTISDTITDAIPKYKNKVIAISGPSHAEEVVKEYHTCLNVAGRYKPARKKISEILTSDFLQCRETDDIYGVEIGGTLKNPAAIAAGMISVLPGCGDNLSGALMSEALKEMINLGKIFGVKEETIVDISGLGDLVATSLSDHSRNRKFGQDIALQIIEKTKKLSLKNKFLIKFSPENIIGKMSENLNYLAEGAYAIKPLIEVADKHGVPIPVYKSLYEVLLNKKDPSLLIETIKNPAKFEEIYSKTKIQISDRKPGLEKVKGILFKKQIFENSLEILSSEDDNIEEKHHNNKITIDSLKRYYNTNKSQDTLLQKKENNIIGKISNKNFDDSISSLIKLYIKSITDNFTPLFKWFFVKFIVFLNIYNRIKFLRKRINISGDLKKIKDSTVNVIYIATFRNFYDFIPLIFAINKKRLPFPRFFISDRAIKSNLKRKFLKLAGGFIINCEMLNNIVYREVLSQYITILIKHGVPLLYFPENIPGTEERKFSIKYDFFSIIVESLFNYNVEISLIPIEISYFNKSIVTNSNDLSISGYFKNRVNLNFSDPIFLSEYTKNPYSITGITDIIKSVWNIDFMVTPQSILCNILYENKYIVDLSEAVQLIVDSIVKRDIDILIEPDKILKEGIEFLKANKIIKIRENKIIGVKYKDIDFYAGKNKM